jgi:Flp pilus assembly protein TadD
VRGEPFLVAALAVVAFVPSLHGSDIAFDTPWLVFDNPILSTGDPLQIPRILTDFAVGTRLVLGAEYLPVRDLAVLLDFALFGRNFLLHHASNLVWYAIGCVGFLAFARRLLPAPAAFAAAALFAVLPAHTESVAWLASKKDVVLLALFFPAVMLAMRESAAGPMLAAPVALAACWAKNTAVMLPAFTAAALVLAMRRPLWDSALRCTPMAIASVGVTALSTRVGKAVSMFAEPRADTAWEWVALQGRILVHDLLTVVRPVGHSLVYPEPDLAVSALNLTAALAWVLLLAAIPWLRARRPLWSFAVAGWFAALLPVTQIVPIQNLFADRYVLVPSAAFCVGLLAALPERARRGVILLAILLLPASWARTITFRSTEAIWADAVASYPALPSARVALAGAVGDRSREEELGILQQAAQDFPNDAAVRGALGRALLQRGNLDEAEVALRAAAADRNQRKAWNNLVVLLQRTQRLPEAEREGAAMVALHDLYAEGWNTHGVTLLSAGRPREAADAFERAVRLGDADAVCNLGSARWNADDHAFAAALYRRCLERRPEHAVAQEALRRFEGR